MRLASLYGPEAIAQAPRARRFRTEAAVRVVTGLQALTRAIAEIDRLPEAARMPGVSAAFDEVTQLVNPTANPESVARRIRGASWTMTDRSDTGAGCSRPPRRRRRARRDPRDPGRRPLDAGGGPPHAAPAGRRHHRRRRDHRAARGARAAAHVVAPADGARQLADRPFFGIYLPAHADNRQSAQRSLIGPRTSSRRAA
jgi:hypothetical protein